MKLDTFLESDVIIGIANDGSVHVVKNRYGTDGYVLSSIVDALSLVPIHELPARVSWIHLNTKRVISKSTQEQKDEEERQKLIRFFFPKK